VGERLLREGQPERSAGAADRFELGEDRFVAFGVDHHGDGLEVLRRRTHHRRSADIDLFDDVGVRRPRGRRLAERIQVHHDQVERLDPVLGECRDVIRPALVGQDARVDPRVERLDPAPEHLREPGDVRDRRDRHPRVPETLRRVAGRDDAHAERREPLRERGEAGLVGHRDQGALDRQDLGRFGHTCSSSWITTRRPSTVSRPSISSRAARG
jgi:hypothetical protein